MAIEHIVMHDIELQQVHQLIHCNWNVSGNGSSIQLTRWLIQNASWNCEIHYKWQLNTLKQFVIKHFGIMNISCILATDFIIIVY